jgi:hypothetical protein
VYTLANIPKVFGKKGVSEIISVLTLTLQILSVITQADSTYKSNSFANFDFE